MNRNLSRLLVFSLVLFAGFSCSTSYQSNSLQYQLIRISDSLKKDNALEQVIRPYHEKVNSTMNDVIGKAEVSLDKKQPESTLGNFMADACFFMAEENYKTKVDAAFVNYGGVRLNQLPAGTITNGKVFELMPFDNILILQKIKGSVLQDFLNLIAARNGWPVAGLTMQIQNKKAVNVVIGGKPLDPNAMYTIVNSDFVANGGDGTEMLKSIPQISNGYLMRDALLEYIKKLTREGRSVRAVIENRISHAE